MSCGKLGSCTSGKLRPAPFVPMFQLVIEIYPPKNGGAFILENAAQKAKNTLFAARHQGTSF
jgi:hypothetical protein